MTTITKLILDKEQDSLNKKNIGFETPQSLKIEHQELHSDLSKIIKLGGSIGESAQKVADILHPHFVKEEEYATPPLGLLQSIVEDNLNGDTENAMIMTSKLKANLPEMVEEHKQIVKALNNLIDVAKRNNNSQVEKFAEKLILHANNEEEILYPASILIGEYLKLKLFK